MREILQQKDFTKYYKEVLRLIKINRNESTQENGLDEFYREMRELDYEKVEKRMRLIDDNLWNIDIYLSINVHIWVHCALTYILCLYKLYFSIRKTIKQTTIYHKK